MVLSPLLWFAVVFSTTELICVQPQPEVVEAVYYILPTEKLSSCHGNNRCLPGQVCHKINYFVQNSHKFFSPDHINVALIFMCGVHNFTKNLIVRNLHSFVMKGETEFKENVIINMLYETTEKLQLDMESNRINCTSIQFFNVSYVNITSLSVKCPSISHEGGLISIRNSNLSGYINSTSEIMSTITVLTTSSEALLDNCTFKENCFVVSYGSAGISINNSTFQSYKHEFHSIITAYSSVITITGIVNFTDSEVGHNTYKASGTALCLTNRQSKPSLLYIAADAVVHFDKLTCINGSGGAVSVDEGVIDISTKATVVFTHNRATFCGGAVCLIGSMNIGVNSVVLFAYNSADDYDSGAIYIECGTLRVKPNASVSFSYNSAPSGGAVTLDTSIFEINTGASVLFHSNTATQGGGMFLTPGAHMCINNHSSENHINTTKLIFSKNSASQGGAIYIQSLTFAIEVRINSKVQFVNNTATDVGGAVYYEMQSAVPCMFNVTDDSAEIYFIGNFANRNIGHHMYGTSIRHFMCGRLDHEIPSCVYDNTTKHIKLFCHPDLSEILSPVSSAAWRVCLCDSNGRPQCADLSQIFTNVSVYRGETFTLSVCVVGYDFGTTAGIVHAQFVSKSSNLHAQLEKFQYNQLLTASEKCSTVSYTVYTKHNDELMSLTTSVLPANVYNPKELIYQDIIGSEISYYRSNTNFGCLHYELLTTPVFIKVRLLSGCPPGLTLRVNSTKCTCYSVLTNNAFNCFIHEKTGYLKWNTTIWVNTSFNAGRSDSIIYNPFCPPQYCKLGEKIINIGGDPNQQCVSNRAGILCGACKKNFSLAIGSSRCIECPNSIKLTLVLLFAAGGVFLVFFILAFNLSVTHGLINGLIFYANIVWAYKIIFFPSETQENSVYMLPFLQIFIAWLNLDFGIETCFFVRLDAYWKIWLQFLFPLYIWAIAGAIIVACRYSSRLTNLIGSRAVPLLATLFLLSFMKLLRTIVDVTLVAVITQYPKDSSFAVWYLDGNLSYCRHPHIYLFIVAITALVLLWLPYTLLLLFIQPLRRVSHLKRLRWINKFAPVYDAYFHPLKDKHQYWFGILLLVRGVLLVVLTVTYTTSPKLNVFILSVTMTGLLFYTSAKNVYKQISVRVLESTTLMNLLVLNTGTLYKWESATLRISLLQVSIGVCLGQFCIIVLYTLISCWYHACCRCRQRLSYDIIDENPDDTIHKRIEDPETDSLLNIAGNTKKKGP